MGVLTAAVSEVMHLPWLRELWGAEEVQMDF